MSLAFIFCGGCNGLAIVDDDFGFNGCRLEQVIGSIGSSSIWFLWLPMDSILPTLSLALYL